MRVQSSLPWFALVVFILSLHVGCGDGSPHDPDSDVNGYVGTGSGASIVTIHSPQRKPKQIRNLPIGVSITRCQPNLPDEFEVDPKKTIETYTHLNDGYDELRRRFLKHATPLTKPMYLNRWGEKEFESVLIERSEASQPVFDIFEINHGASFEGRGLYLDLTPIGSFGYSVFTYFNHIAAGDWRLELPMLTTARVPKGTLYINFEKRNFLKERSDLKDTYNAFIQADQKAPYTPVPVMIHYNEILDHIPLTRNPNAGAMGEKIKTRVGSNWHVLKSTEGVEIKEFDGQEYSTEDLIEFERVMRAAVIKKKVKHSEKVYHYYQTRVAPILSKRVFRPGAQEVIPAPLTSLYPAKVWGHFDEMKHCIGAKIPSPYRDEIHYYWRYDGTCGGYADLEAQFLVVDPTSKRDESNYYPLRDPSNQPCLKKFPSQSVWIQDDQLGGVRCMDVIPLKDQELKSKQKTDRIHYIVLGKHSNEADCGSH